MKRLTWHRKTGEVTMMGTARAIMMTLMNLEFSIFEFMGLKCFNFPMYSINTIYNLINISVINILQ